jgi:hypothetical protein
MLVERLQKGSELFELVKKEYRNFSVVSSCGTFEN